MGFENEFLRLIAVVYSYNTLIYENVRKYTLVIWEIQKHFSVNRLVSGSELSRKLIRSGSILCRNHGFKKKISIHSSPSIDKIIYNIGRTTGSFLIMGGNGVRRVGPR